MIFVFCLFHAPAGRSRGLLCELLSAGQRTVEHLRRDFAKLEEGVRQLCYPRVHTGTKLTLAEDIRMTSMEALFPGDIESHIQMNHSRLVDYPAAPHLKQRGTPTCEELESLDFFVDPLQTSMTRATVEERTAGLGQTLRTERALVGGLSFHGVS